MYQVHLLTKKMRHEALLGLSLVKNVSRAWDYYCYDSFVRN